MDKLDLLDGMDGSDLLQDTFLFARLNFDETATLAAEFETRTWKAGETVFEENSIGDAVYVIRGGEADIQKSDGSRIELLATLGAGELFGEMSLIEDALTSATVVARSDLECLVLPKARLQALMDADDAFARKVYQSFCQTLSERLRKTSSELFRLRGQEKP
jgi:CRP-like cAMP-binding protein